jgi:hypothetical protein
LTTPAGFLLANRNSGNDQQYPIADGLSRDEEKYGTYKPGDHGYNGIHPILENIEGPHSRTRDLDPTYVPPKPGPKIPNIYFTPPVHQYPGSAGPAGGRNRIHSDFDNKRDQ